MGHTTMKKTILALSLAVAAACFGIDSRVADSITVKDAAGRSIAITDPSRIVSVGGAVTEILYALRLESRIIAVDSTSLYPPHALAEKPSVGYMRQLSPEGVLGLGPSLVSLPRARVRRTRSQCWRPRRCPSCKSPTGSPATVSSRKSG